MKTSPNFRTEIYGIWDFGILAFWLLGTVPCCILATLLYLPSLGWSGYFCERYLKWEGGDSHLTKVNKGKRKN